MHSTTTSFGDANPHVFDPAIDVPEYLRQYLTTTENPREIYTDRTHASERRLRLLYRRFLNQITHGCKNPYCDVPTCLSYRKRLAGHPVRPYTDVSARALATKCVEQYASHGRDLGRPLRRDHGKTRQTAGAGKGCLCSDGLCYSEPVVPWYTDPEVYLAKIKAATSSQGRPRHNGVPRSQSLTQNGFIQYGINQADQTKSAMRPRSENEDGQQASRTEAEKLHEAALLPDEPGLPTTSYVNGVQDPSPRKPRSDTASFVQSLFARSELRGFSEANTNDFSKSSPRVVRRPASRGNETIPDESILSANEMSAKLGKQKERTDNEGSDYNSPRPGGVPHMARSSNVRPTYTFKLLPSSAIMWLRSMLIRQSDQSNKQEAEPSVPTPLDLFVEQSLYFVLSDPRRLMWSASTWDDYVGFRNLEDVMGTELDLSQAKSQHLSRSANNIRSTEATTNHDLTANNIASLGVPTYPKWTSVLKVCADLVQFVPKGYGGPRIMRHILQAMQQAFVVPSSMKQLGSAVVRANDHIGPLTNDETARLITTALAIATTLQYVIPGLDVEYNHATDAAEAAFDEGIHARGMNGQVFSRGTLIEVQPSWDSSNVVSRDFPNKFWPYDHHISELYTEIASVISNRAAIDAVRKARAIKSGNMQPDTDIVRAIAKFLHNPAQPAAASTPQLESSIYLLQFMQAVLLTRWERVPTIPRASHVAGALEMLKGLYTARDSLKLDDSEFVLDFLADAFDEIEMPYAWLCFKPDTTKMHILQFPFLFPPIILVRYFRSLNFKVMKLSHERAMGVYANAKAQLIHAHWQVRGLDEVLDKARAHMARYFVMTIRRGHVLEDAIEQIWRRERQELMRPLRVRLGQDDGEEGLDHGGVQQEFFRLVFVEAFDPQFGMFTTDETTHMTWFQPGSLEPLYKFEALGILMSLAIFNGVTVPITMPLAFYRKILGLKVKKIQHIADGWPQIAKSFEDLLGWEDGDVGDVIGRTYEFTYEAFGSHVDINMSKKSTSMPTRNAVSQSDGNLNGIRSLSHANHKGIANGVHYCGRFASLDIDDTSDAGANCNTDCSAAEEAPLVTNANRHNFVKDYISHLTDVTIATQFTAFLRGLHTLLSPRSLALFTPAVLKQLVEGLPTSQPLDLNSWKETTIYDGFSASDPIMTWFWDILGRDFTQQQLRALLAFVTASDRIPVGGWAGVTFIIQRNGDEDGRLPTSQTCYGRLLLPEYSSREVLKGRLGWAVENSWGFWMA